MASHDTTTRAPEDPATDPECTPLPALLDDARRVGFGELHRRLEAEGHPQIRNAHGCVFRYIDIDGSRLTDLAALSGVTKQAVGEFVDELQQLGYVERAPDPIDGRAKIIRLTERGRDARRTALRIFDDIEREWADRFGEDRVAELREILEAIAEEDRVAAPADRLAAAYRA
jgi:DNA-binding MarR family transcriptional regulator